MLHLQKIARAVFDHVRDGMTVSRPAHQGLQHQHVERALEHVARKSGLARVAILSIDTTRRSTEEIVRNNRHNCITERLITKNG